MITLNKKYKKTVVAARDDIARLALAEEAIFEQLLKEVGVEEDTPEAESLSDHVFNGSAWTVKYTNR